MASIRKYATNTGTAWRVQYRSPDGKNRTKQGFRTKTEAQTWANKNAVAITEGSWINPQHGKTTINELVEKWFAISDGINPRGAAAWKEPGMCTSNPTGGTAQ